MANRLAAETSPYLLQHRDDPVDWYPWGGEALERARREDKPILLSLGYSTCHWCHVMARESFQDPALAALMNEHFVCVKVDREERPDLDQVYQAAHQLLTGRPGGWPLTLFLAPDQTPFFGGTYFPPVARFTLPGFPELLRAVAAAWRDRRPDIEAQNAVLRAALADSGAEGPSDGVPGPEVPPRALADIRRGFDPVHGGFGGAPKFPRPAELEFLLHRGDAEARRQALFTLARMAEGGLMDQLGGGFFRYSVDERWAIPHFEKMLYDNGPLLGLYADAWSLAGEPLYARAAGGIVDWLAREMTDDEGAFHAALDADTGHEEGAFYLWTPAQARALLDEAEYAVAAAHWGLDAPPNFEGRAWHLGVARPLDQVAAGLGLEAARVADLLAGAARKLFAARQGRTRPGRDDKRLTAWNALMIKGLARAARRLDRPDWLAMARRAADTLRRRVWRDGRLYANWMDGRARLDAYLDDHAFLLDALLELIQTDYHQSDLDWAVALADALLARFRDETAGGFWFTSHDHEALPRRDKPAYDQATPSGNGVAAQALARLGHLLAEPRWLAAAEGTLAAHGAVLTGHPQAAPGLLTALAEYHRPPPVVLLRGGPAALDQWRRVARAHLPPGALLLALPLGLTGLPAVLDKPGDEAGTAHVCAGENCLAPVVRLDGLPIVLQGLAVN